MLSRKEADRRLQARGMTCPLMLAINPDGTSEVVEKLKGPSGIGAVEAFTARCHMCGEEIGWGPFYTVEDRRVHITCTKEF